MLLTLGTIRYCPSHFSDLLSSFHALFPLSPHHFHLMFSSSVLPSQPSFIHSVNIFSSQLRTLLAYPMLLSLLVVSMPYRLPTYWTPPRGMLGTVSHFSSLFSLAFLSPFTLHSSHYHIFLLTHSLSLLCLCPCVSSFLLILIVPSSSPSLLFFSFPLLPSSQPLELWTTPAIVPQIHLYSDGGLDISHCGNYILTCAILYVSPRTIAKREVLRRRHEATLAHRRSFSPISHRERSGMLISSCINHSYSSYHILVHPIILINHIHSVSSYTLS